MKLDQMKAEPQHHWYYHRPHRHAINDDLSAEIHYVAPELVAAAEEPDIGQLVAVAVAGQEPVAIVVVVVVVELLPAADTVAELMPDIVVRQFAAAADPGEIGALVAGLLGVGH